KPILQTSCFRCHGPERPKSGLRLDSREGVMKGGDGGQIVAPGKSKESLMVIAVSQLDDETAMPPKRMPGGPGSGGFGGGGPMGGGPGGMIAQQRMKQGGKDEDKKLSKEEMGALGENWFDKLDSDKSGKVSQEQFVAKFNEIVPMPQRQGFGGGGFGGGGQRGGPGGGGPGGAGGGGGPQGGGGGGGGGQQGGGGGDGAAGGGAGGGGGGEGRGGREGWRGGLGWWVRGRR